VEGQKFQPTGAKASEGKGDKPTVGPKRGSAVRPLPTSFLKIHILCMPILLPAQKDRPGASLWNPSAQRAGREASFAAACMQHRQEREQEILPCGLQGWPDEGDNVAVTKCLASISKSAVSTVAVMTPCHGLPCR
jgi:hypothetical protein